MAKAVAELMLNNQSNWLKITEVKDNVYTPKLHGWDTYLEEEENYHIFNTKMHYYIFQGKDLNDEIVKEIVQIDRMPTVSKGLSHADQANWRKEMERQARFSLAINR